MTHGEPVRTSAHRARWTILAAVVVAGAALVGVVDYHSSAASSPAATAPPSAAPPIAARPLGPRPQVSLNGEPAGPAGVADGVVPDGVTVFDNNFPAVGKLEPDLLAALRQAATDAGHAGIVFYVNSGWRDAKYQEQLLQQAISKYGSEKAAAKWVATPDTSAHVSGNAVDIGHADAAAWLSKYGARFGLCQIYQNETWHYELRPEAIEHGCPAMYADPTQDPRMQQ